MTDPHETAAGTPQRAAVMLPLPLAGAYDYAVPEGFAVAPGDFVQVPLGGRDLVGVVWEQSTRGGVDEARLKSIRARIDAPALPAVSRRLVEWVADYTVQPPGAVLRMAMSVPEALWPPPPETGLRPAGPLPEGLRLTPARQRVLALANAGPPLSAAALARMADVGGGVVRALVASGALIPVPLPRAALPEQKASGDRPGLCLSGSQAQAAAALSARIGEGFSVTLLDGVAGSGKTEVYFEAVAEVLRHGRQVLVLLPEIALGSQWLGRFAQRFGAEPASWHSEVPRSQRRRTWRGVAEGRIPVVVGARSALFLPFPDLALIVVDEEHDTTFKQEDGVAYHARDMAVIRARLGAIPAILASATPSLETLANVAAGRYRLVELPARHAPSPLPTVATVDLRTHRPPAGAWLAPPLRAAVGDALSSGSQALLFLNRRGYAPLTLCRACGHRLECPNCTAWLVEHRLLGRLQCHHCDYRAPLPGTCPACGAAESLSACGPGIERVAEEARRCWPEARIAIASSDTLTGPTAAADLVRRMEAGAIDLVVGTQIVAKGYHFPLLTTVGIVDADLGLGGGDLRAAERTFQVLFQVAGRAGRAERPGRVLIQTHMPDHPVMTALAARDRDRFIAAESEARRRAGMPPYARLAAIVVSGRDELRVEEAARALARASPETNGVRILGPAPPPLALLRGRHRRRLLLIAGREMRVPELVRRWLGAFAVPAGVRVQVDIDPYSFL